MANESAIAIVGMSGRFPGAPTLTQFWQDLKNGVESIRTLTDAELVAAGVSQEEFSNEDYVKSGAVLQDLDMFDAAFFGLSKIDASIMDPQHRVFLECAWEALENAGHVPETFAGSIGVYAGSGMNWYMIHNLLTNHQLVQSAGSFLIRQTGNDKDVLASRVSYELNLHGPSISVQTACSTSLVAIHLACQSLLNQECDMALAGGVTIELPHGRGYVYREGEILSRDGHCRAFDADASGTVFSSGAGVVVLRRLEDALADRDTIHAVILGSAINNDGARKAGFLAPSVDGQAEVITEALQVSGVEPADIAYIETHGTGTKVGDPIEIKALTQVYGQAGLPQASCAIGSLKTNIGHLDTAAGVAGLIKTVLALKNREIPPSLHFHKPNPLIDFASGPFCVNSKLTEWQPRNGTRRAGVTSLGIGGTNAHVILEEAPPIAADNKSIAAKPYQLLVLSAKTATALDPMSRNLCSYLQENPELDLRDVAYTLQVGRKPMAYRRAIVAATHQQAITLLQTPQSKQVLTGQVPAKVPGVVFMFSGQGSQYVQMGRELYETEAIFRAELDFCAERLIPELGLDLRRLLFPPEQESATAAEKLARTCYTQPALFSIEYAKAKWWMAHGVVPAAMIGHSIGEYVAACLAAVFSVEDALRLTAIRGRLMDQMPCGSMLSVSAKPDSLSIPQPLSLAAVNAPEQCVVSGPTARIQEYANELEKQGTSARVLHTSHAFHSAMMDPVLGAFAAEVANVPRCAPRLPYISNLTGTWITPAEATSPEYWAKHLRNAVQFSRGLAELFRDPSLAFLEVGPGQVLASLARQHSARPKSSRVFSSMRHPQDRVSDAAFVLNTAGQLWLAGCSMNWDALHDGYRPRRIPLPTYSFERQRYWIEPSVATSASSKPVPARASAQESAPPDSWFQQRIWKQVPKEGSDQTGTTCWLIFMDEAGLGAEISSQLKPAGHEVVQVSAGTKYERTGTGQYTIRPNVRDDYDQLLGNVDEREHLPTKIVHLWPVMKTEPKLDRTLDLCFYSLLYLAQALGDQDLEQVDITSVSNGLQSISGEKVVAPARAVSFGPVRVIPKEFPATSCCSIDVDWKMQDIKSVAGRIIAECAAPHANACVAWRQSERWVESFEATSVAPRTAGTRLKERGTYWITGGMGGIGLVIAEHLARSFHARLVLTGRKALPPISEWDALLKQPEKANGACQTIRKIRELEALGSEVLTVAADVTDSRQMKAVVDLARKRFGELNGVFHAAGLIEDGPLQIKTHESAARVLAPKLEGTVVLQDVLRDCKLDFLMLFSSISSIAPPPGQIDYAAANAFLDAFALSETGHPTTALNWTLWTDVGMANTASIIHPIVGRRLVQTASESVYSTRMSCTEDWLLGEHRFKTGESLVPGTGYLELAAAAMLRDRFESGVEFEDVFFLAPLRVRPDETKEVRVRLRRQRSGYRFSILAQDNDWIEYASGQVSRNNKPSPAPQKVEEIRVRCSARRIDFDEQRRTRQEKYFDFGPRWRSLRSLHIGEREALAELQLGGNFAADLNTWQLHPAILDLATGSSLYLIKGYENSDTMYFPLSYKRISFFRPIPGKVYSHIRCPQENTSQREIATFDLTLMDEKGRVLAEIHEFSLRRMATEAESLVAVANRRSAEGYNEAIEVSADHGITSQIGIKALDQILSGDLRSNLIIHRGELSAKLPVSQAPSSHAVAAKADGGVETVLAEWWQELLGIERVGHDDDFFDLGGHSLIAVRLFSKIKKTFRVDLALSTLFESRTIRQLGNLIRQVGTSTSSHIQKADAPTVVPIRSQGSRLPLFLISGLGGAVIKFHTLVRHLGEDQPVYALQPQGIDGKKPFLTRIEDMAAYYIEQVKNVQPQGPYCLAGYSFGGYVVFEMAQQLHAAGDTVALLGFLDTIEYQYQERLRRLSGVRWERWQMRINRFKNGGQNYAKGAARSFVGRVAYRVFGTLHRPLPQGFSKLHWVNGFAMSQYRPTVYPGQLIIFRSVNREVSFENDELLGWGGMAARGIEVCDVTGAHLEMLYEPNVRILAKQLRSRLDHAQAKAHNTPPSQSAEILASR